jgi:tetratricopeptide (TPR) repeat protein
MKNKSVISAWALVLFLLTIPVATNKAIGSQEKTDAPKVSDAEAKAISAFNAAADAAAKLTVAEEFVKKFPKSVILPQMSLQLASEISNVTDATQKLALADRFEKTFRDDKALAIVRSARLDGLVAANRIDEAFTLAASILEKDPEELHALMQMTFAGADEAKRGNGQHVQLSQQYGARAIQLIEANKKPVNMDDVIWTNHKAALAQLYQQTGVLAMLTKNLPDAKARLNKAIELQPNDPSSHAVLAYLANSDYMDMANTYKAMPEGKAKSEMLPKVESQMDAVIEEYARVVALATGNPKFQALLQQVMTDLTSYYKYRHQSVEGLQQLIDKYKPAKP